MAMSQQSAPAPSVMMAAHETCNMNLATVHESKMKGTNQHVSSYTPQSTATSRASSCPMHLGRCAAIEVSYDTLNDGCLPPLERYT